MAATDPQVIAHLEWLGFVRPVGLVVSAMTLNRAGATLPRRDIEGQERLRDCVEEGVFAPNEEPAPFIPDFRAFATSVLGWRLGTAGYAGTDERPIPPELELALPEYGETLCPDYAVIERDPQPGAAAWQLLVGVLEPGARFEAGPPGSQLEASHHGRMERLLRGTGVQAGLLFNGRALRLISAPRGETSGHIDFLVADMVQTSGRPIAAAMRLLLNERRLLGLAKSERLAALLESSRRFQNEVSERLAEQVLQALYELLRGFQAAHDVSGDALLREPLSEHPDEVYRALLTVVLRMVFLLFAEERAMLPDDETFVRHYSLAQLYEQLREDAALYPDTMDQRYGAWARLLVLFRLLHDGARAGDMTIPQRHGVLFDPDRFPFLEGRTGTSARQKDERIDPPMVPDGTIYRAMEKLLVLDGERISYLALDVEQIGSVYETMMGFRLEMATGASVAIRPQKKQGAPTVVDLDALLLEAPGKRERWLQDRAERKLSESVKKAVQAATDLTGIHAALAGVIDIAATPDLVPPGAMVLQPSEERRRSGSHYTPRSLTEPIVRTTLEPILARLRGGAAVPTPEAILDLKVCDHAMGSGAFLVESCRQLADQLVEAWKVHGGRPEVPPDEDELVFARRLVAMRCLYGVDRNPMAVDLAKVSLWLVTLARDHALTFLDHALRHGDSLVGLSRALIEGFNWDAAKSQRGFEVVKVREHVDRVLDLRRQIRDADSETADFELRDLWKLAQAELEEVRLFGDLVVAAFFEGTNPKTREARRLAYAAVAEQGSHRDHADELAELRHSDPPLAPFHWEVELPEVFERENPGFDAFVGNPPFAGKNSVSGGNVAGYPDWIKFTHEESHGNADLVAHFFRRAFTLLRRDGTFGLIATNTIAQGDTRSSGLRWICQHGGDIFEARRRYKWPGMAAVVVSVVHVFKGEYRGRRLLDGGEAERITAFLFHRGGSEDPMRLAANARKSFQGSIVLGMGFTFDDTDTKGVASSLEEMRRLIAENPKNAEIIFPYIGGEEVNDDPAHGHHRYVIDFFDRPLELAAEWPELLAVVRDRVKPERDTQKRDALRERWWQFAEKRPGLIAAKADTEYALSCALHSKDLSFARLPARAVFSHGLAVFPLDSYGAFCALQSRPHEVWARFFGSSLEDRLRYTPSDCFETFPFPPGWETDPALEAAGREYYEFRAALMVRNNEGLTKTYNRFHDPDERSPDILQLRDLHEAMDRAVLLAYGWDSVPTRCEFLLDYEVDEEEAVSRRKKPWRYRWPEEVRDDVLARLLELNAERAAEEERLGIAPRGGPNRASDDGGESDMLGELE
jgi:hypothetical protein